MALPLAMHIILEHVPLERRGFMVGVSTMATCFVPAIGPTYGGDILHEFNWNQIFLFLVPVLACSFVTGIISFHSTVSVSALDLNSSLWRVTVMIREFQRDDINKVADIWLDTNIKAHNFIPAEYWKSNFKSVKEALLLAEVYVYEYDTEIQGFIGLNDEYVEGIFVSGEMQSQGIGKILLNYAKDKRNKLHLNVYQKNTRAISFYKREGFEIQHSGLDEATGEKDYVMTWQRK